MSTPPTDVSAHLVDCGFVAVEGAWNPPGGGPALIWTDALKNVAASYRAGRAKRFYSKSEWWLAASAPLSMSAAGIADIVGALDGVLPPAQKQVLMAGGIFATVVSTAAYQLMRIIAKSLPPEVK